MQEIGTFFNKTKGRFPVPLREMNINPRLLKSLTNPADRSSERRGMQSPSVEIG